MRRLNLGCGDIYHKDWLNLDVFPHSEQVLKYNLNMGIPYCDETFDFVYHSHILEHFSHKRGKFFLEECFRVLKAGAPLRIVIPDLEGIARNYVQALDDIKANKEGAQARRRWMTIELLDQIVREKSGGEMTEFTQQHPVPEAEFVVKRCGKAFADAIKYYEAHPVEPQDEHLTAHAVFDQNFKSSGELHQWMYDFYALEELLSEIGFINIERKKFNTSNSVDFLKYGFDSDENGNIRKPDSLFIEAIKPAAKVVEKKLKVAIFNALDFGGAAIAAHRQHVALRKIGVASEFYTGYQKHAASATHIVPLQNISFVNATNGDVFLHSFLNYWQHWCDGFNQYSQAQGLSEYCFIHGDSFNPHDIKNFEDIDLINLEWVAGFADPTVHPEYYQDKPVVMTLHDMNAMTGGCFYSCGCRKFETCCENCPLFKDINGNSCQVGGVDIANQIFKKRLAAYQKLNLHIVTPSTWLADEAKKSTLLRHFPVTVINYAQPLDVFKPLNRQKLRSDSGFSPNDIILLFTADAVNSIRKGTSYLLEMLRKLSQTDLARRLVVLIMGSNPPDEFSNLSLRTQLLGFVDKQDIQAKVYNIADALIVPSLEDNLPNTICESLGCGTPVIAFKSGGIPEMILHGQTGWLADKRNSDDLVMGVTWLATVYAENEIRERCRTFAVEHYDEKKQAEKYFALYQNLKENFIRR